MFSRSRRTLAVLACLLALTACTPQPDGRGGAFAAKPEIVPVQAEPTNIVFVLADDFSTNLVRYMPNLLAMRKDGTSFSNYTVTDSLCCPSRASILKGQFPHNTGIYKNHGSDGGFVLFRSRGQEKSTFATDLQAAGYRTAFLGKYLNEYLPGNNYVPPGWDQWFAGGNAYDNFNYALNENGKIKKYGRQYLTDVLSTKASQFIKATAKTGTPFLVEISTYAPHAPFTPAPRDSQSFPGLKAPRTAAYDQVPVDAPAWLATHPRLTLEQRNQLDVEFRKRVQSVQSIDRMLGSLRTTLAAAGVADRTVVFFTSDNGFHMGEYRLPSGKQTAFDTDVNVPLIVTGHGVAAGQTVDVPVENIDLRPTFAGLAGAGVPAGTDGRSIEPLLAGEVPDDWRTAALIEHHDPATDPADPDYEHDSINIPPSYDALRTARFTYVEYVDGTREYYDRRTDPHQLRNLPLSAQRAKELHKALDALRRCAGPQACLAAGRGIS